MLAIDVSGRPDAWITWKARPGHRPELRPRQWSGIEIHGSYHVIEGLTLVGGNDEVTLIEALAAAKASPKLSRFNTNGIFVEGRRNAPDASRITSSSATTAYRRCRRRHRRDRGRPHHDRGQQGLRRTPYMEYAGSGISLLNNWAFDDAPAITWSSGATWCGTTRRWCRGIAPASSATARHHPRRHRSDRRGR
jgi:hypothetical protein